jgi:hypothetical protein
MKIANINMWSVKELNEKIKKEQNFYTSPKLYNKTNLSSKGQKGYFQRRAYAEKVESCCIVWVMSRTFVAC